MDCHEFVPGVFPEGEAESIGVVEQDDGSGEIRGNEEGCVTMAATREWISTMIHSRGPREPSVRGLSVLSASVTGAPRTRNTGTIMVRAM